MSDFTNLIPDLQNELSIYFDYIELLNMTIHRLIDVDLNIITRDSFWKRQIRMLEIEDNAKNEDETFIETFQRLFWESGELSASVFVLLLDRKNNFYSWGFNLGGALGIGETNDFSENKPIQTTFDFGKFEKISAGSSHSLGIDKFGKLYVWGRNDEGQLGLGLNGGHFNEIDTQEWEGYEIFEPVHTLKSERFTEIAAGNYHSLALSTSGKIYSTGLNIEEQLGLRSDEVTVIVWSPIQINDENKNSIIFKTIAAGDSHSLALDTKGKLYAWGSNNSGQLGLTYWDDNPDEPNNFPGLVNGLHSLKTISAGGNYSMALDSDGKLYTWGSNEWGQLGLNYHDHNNGITQPRLVKGLPPLKDISAGDIHSLALDFNGKVYTWGFNLSGDLRSKDINSSDDSYIVNEPVMVKNIPLIVKICTGNNISVLFSSTGKLYTRGINGNGQLGLGDYINRNKFTEVEFKS
jgi:alpha-tubulin suppressor-like RCC1 family protein